MKFFTALFVALVAVHATTQSPVEDTSITKIIADALDKVLKKTQNILDDANSWTDKLDSNKEHYETHAVEVLTKVGVKIDKEIMKLVEKLREDASDNSKAIIDCVEAEKAEIDAIIGKVLQQIIGCEFENYDDFSALVKIVVGQLNQLQANFETLSSNLRKCDGGDTLCVLLFIAGAGEEVEDVIAKAKADLVELKGLISGIKESTKQCKIIEAIHKDATEVLDHAAECIYT